ncbi:MAG: hypothetical protein E6J91_10870 [Deltaproteobacteria bacterium]|nr:MAG: hypothetical protein E6J91_10870 [Deltaproteobacteria bacterium]
MTADTHLTVTPRMRQVPIALCAVGVIAFAVGLILSPERTWLNLLVDGFLVLALGVIGIFFMASQRLASSKWWAPIRRIPEAFSLLLPVAAVLMIVLAFGFHKLYPWVDPSSPELVDEHPLIRAGRLTYLSPAFVYVRMVVIVGLWTFFALRMRKISLGGDASAEAGLSAHARLYRYSGAFAPLFALTFAMASYDWVISLEPKWFSTMFSVYVFAGAFVEGIAAVALVTVILKRKQLFGPEGKVVDTHVVQTLGTMILAFSTFWGYIWIAQYLLVWYGNIPEEAFWYLERNNGGWLPLLLGSFAVSWVIPFFTLLPIGSKRSLKMMMGMSIFVLAGRWLDLYILVMPSKESSPQFGPLEIGMAAGAVGLVWLVVIRGLSRAPLIPPHEPVIAARRRLDSGHA